MEMLKKKWETPELVVIVRSKPEEAVLIGCKNINFATASVYVDGCVGAWYTSNDQGKTFKFDHCGVPPLQCNMLTAS